LRVHEAIATPSPPEHVIPFISHVGHSFTEHIPQVLEKEAANKANEPQTTTSPSWKKKKSMYISQLSQFDTETVFFAEVRK